MYAVIKTGGKQYRVQPGDVIVVEKLDGDAGADIKFDSVLMLGGDKGVTLGAPLIDGAFVGATLVETRKGEKIKIFKKTRRQGYRRTNGHRQMESVLRITGIEGAGETAKWDGKVELITKAEINLRARDYVNLGLARRFDLPVVLVGDIDIVTAAEQAAAGEIGRRFFGLVLWAAGLTSVMSRPSMPRASSPSSTA